MPMSDDLLELATRCTEKLELDGKARYVPSFSDIEDQCEDEYEELLEAIHEDELFAPVDIGRQEALVEQIAAALPEDKRMLIVELADNHARHVWLQQEGRLSSGPGRRPTTSSVGEPESHTLVPGSLTARPCADRPVACAFALLPFSF